MAGLKAQASVPGPSPLQEQLFFGLLILLMLICLLRNGCAEARASPPEALALPLEACVLRAVLKLAPGRRSAQKQGQRVRQQQEGSLFLACAQRPAWRASSRVGDFFVVLMRRRSRLRADGRGRLF